MAGMIGGMYGGPQGMGDILSLVGATLRDASPGSSGENIAQTRNYLAQRAMQRYQMQAMQGLSGMFGRGPTYQDGPDPSVASPAPVAAPQAGVDDLGGAMGAATSSMAPGPAQAAPQPYQYRPPQMTSTGQPSLSDPATQRALQQAAMFGVPGAKETIDLLDKSRPTVKIGPDGTPYDERSAAALMQHFRHLENVNGTMVDTNDAGNVNRFVPKYADMTGPDGRGGVAPLPGAVQTTGLLAGANTNAQEAAKAAYDLIPVPQSDGSTRLMPRSVALGALTGQSGAPAAPGVGGGVGGGAGGAGPQLGVSQSPAEAELAKARAATQGKNETDISGAKSAMQQVDDQTNMIAQNLHDMLGETQDPNTGKWVKTKPSMVTHLSAGSGTDVIEHIPFLNQQAKDLEAKIETVRNGTSFNSLQAIKNALSAAGDGGSGSIRMTDQTARMLGEINGSLNQDQSGPQFEATVRRHLAQLEALNAARHDLFSSQYKGVRPTTPGQTGPTANYNKPALGSIPLSDRMAEARRRGLIK